MGQFLSNSKLYSNKKRPMTMTFLTKHCCHSIKISKNQFNNFDHVLNSNTRVNFLSILGKVMLIF